MATITFAGNLGRDPEKKSDAAPVRLNVADKESRDESDSPWYDVAVWGKQGDACLSILRKGSKVLVSGQLTMHKHEGKLYPKVRADRVTFLDAKGATTETAREPGADDPDDVFVA